MIVMDRKLMRVWLNRTFKTLFKNECKPVMQPARIPIGSRKLPTGGYRHKHGWVQVSDNYGYVYNRAYRRQEARKILKERFKDEKSKAVL